MENKKNAKNPASPKKIVGSEKKIPLKVESKKTQDLKGMKKESTLPKGKPAK